MTGSRVRCPLTGDLPPLRRACLTAWALAAVTWELGAPEALHAPLLTRLATCAAFLGLGAVAALCLRQGVLAELRRAQEVAGAAQRALLRPLPPRMEGLALAAVQVSASRGATIGGDLYAALPTRYGVRVVMGDVRGHGLPALGAAAAVLGSFREAAYDERDLGGVLRRMERALQRHLRERARTEAADGPQTGPAAEEFVTVLVLEIAPDGVLRALNCGHPWPFRLRRAGTPLGHAEPWAGGETLPPLGVLPLPAELLVRPCGVLLPGEALFLHTDGVADARDRAGRHFPLGGVLREAAGATGTPAGLVAGVHAALLRHTSGQLADDAALLVVRNDRRLVPVQPSGQAVRRGSDPARDLTGPESGALARRPWSAARPAAECRADGRAGGA
ncbi:PP2C family protein-serine/threonine phosphatase [Streptomyces sp. NRRL S-87]|uniref:PP2C family protein-serine/threonine phosphatase n=1 Tax=Streptomyces sp. NRRL S-87 TaxID=1463920 RepID=UPI00099CF30B|nr:PP2C family protein-serine/threonine phosphatase [Streptomyces sp. NRRL S-87]